MEFPNQHEYAIHEAAREGRTSIVENLLKSDPHLAAKRDADGRLPIHWAVSYCHIPIVQLLVAQNNFEPDVQVCNPLCFHEPCVSGILTALKDASGWTPLMIAASLREGDSLVNLLLAKEADVNMKNFKGQTALHFCSSKTNLDVVRILLEHKASARIRDERGQLPIHRAAAVGSALIVKLLIKNNSPINTSDISGFTPLHHAISEGHGDAALLLLKSGAEYDKRDSDGHLAISLAPELKIRRFILQCAEREGLDLQLE
ncbi:MAG: hypothetical protein M1829_000702 [Trizodia sp. TS-e1964]|nr:MAG: hypothetical protein M1829_000702 [Trizodia sp. TS-e1964]